jgi:hypothetical protein
VFEASFVPKGGSVLCWGMVMAPEQGMIIQFESLPLIKLQKVVQIRADKLSLLLECRKK